MTLSLDQFFSYLLILFLIVFFGQLGLNLCFCFMKCFLSTAASLMMVVVVVQSIEQCLFYLLNSGKYIAFCMVLIPKQDSASIFSTGLMTGIAFSGQSSFPVLKVVDGFFNLHQMTLKLVHALHDSIHHPSCIPCCHCCYFPQQPIVLTVGKLYGLLLSYECLDAHGGGGSHIGLLFVNGAGTEGAFGGGRVGRVGVRGWGSGVGGRSVAVWLHLTIDCYNHKEVTGMQRVSLGSCLALALGTGPHCVCDLLLQLWVYHSVVSPSIIVVQVQILIDELDLPTCQLQHGQKHGFVVGRLEPLSLVILQVLLCYLFVEADFEGSEVGNLLRHFPEPVVVDLLGSVGFGPALLDRLFPP